MTKIFESSIFKALLTLENFRLHSKFFSLLVKPIFPYEMCFHQNPATYCNMAIYSNTHNICNTALTILFYPQYMIAINAGNENSI